MKKANVVCWLWPTLMLLLIEASAWAGEISLNGHQFTIAPGFEIQQIAGSPLVDRPIVADFDEQGRLYVADSSGTNDNVQKQLAEKPHRIVRLEDTDGDGQFDKSVVFADKMMFPEGAMWFDGSLYVSAPPSIWKLTDKDGDGQVDERVEWFQGKTLTGCANDLHGPYLGLDGWIYWCKGAFAEQTYERPGRAPLVTKASHIFRRRPEGGLIESVMTGGMDNPVDVVFTPTGERIFTTTFLINPEAGKRDGLIHAIYGGLYGKIHGVIDGHPRTSPEVMPVLVHLGPAAPAGLTRYESTVFGSDHQDNIFACLFNLHKITRHALTPNPNGGGFATQDHEFLVSTNHDFHPTDVLEDADGSLIVIDTGGWYKLCCPSSQLGKPDVKGAIYRIRRTGAPTVSDPRGLKLNWDKLTDEELVELLKDPRPAVRKRVMAQAAKRGQSLVPLLQALISTSPQVARNAVWTLTRIEGDQARAAVRSALSKSDASVRQTALHSISVRQDLQAIDTIFAALSKQQGHELRVALEAIGRLMGSPDRKASADVRLKEARQILNVAEKSSQDRILDHSAIYALFEGSDAATLRTILNDSSLEPSARRMVLIALDQQNTNQLRSSDVSPFLTAGHSMLRDASAWVASRHPEWGGDLAKFYESRLGKPSESASDHDALRQQLARFASSSQEIQAILAQQAQKGAQRLLVLEAMAMSGVREWPTNWVEPITQALAENETDAIVRQAVSTIRALPPLKPGQQSVASALLKQALNIKTEAKARLEAIAALPGDLGQANAENKTRLLEFLVAQLDPNQAPSTRVLAAETLAKARTHWNSDQRKQLVAVLKTAGPLEADRLLGVFDDLKDDELGFMLVTALKESRALTSLRIDALKARFDKLGPNVRKQAEALYTLLNVDAERQRSKLEELLAKTGAIKGDIRRGQAIFNSAKAACSACHKIGYVGGQTGPDLTRIGQVRNERDLLESIAFPSISFVRSYEPIAVLTQDGKVVNGLIKRETPQEMVLATGPNEEVRIARDTIEEVKPGTVSTMPAGLDQQMSVNELADLIAFLKDRK